MQISYEKNELFKALNTAREKLKQPEKNRKNPFFKANYVDLGGVTSSVDEAIKGTGLAYLQNTTVTDDNIGASTVITHSSGQFIELDPIILPVKGKKDAQAYGSALTYSRRYSLAAAFGISDAMDDDGNDAVDYGNQHQKSTRNQQIRSNYQPKNQTRNNVASTKTPSKPNSPAVKAAKFQAEIAKLAKEYDELTGSEAGTTIKFAYELENVKQGTTNIDELTKVGKCIKAKLDEKKAGK